MQAKYDVVEASKSTAPAGVGFSLPLQQTQSAEKRTPTTPIERHHRDQEPCEILPYMFVGAEAHAENEALMRKYGFTHVLNLTTRSPTRHPGIEYCVIEIRVRFCCVVCVVGVCVRVVCVCVCGCVWVCVGVCGWVRVGACGCVWVRVGACGCVCLATLLPPPRAPCHIVLGACKLTLR